MASGHRFEHDCVGHAVDFPLLSPRRSGVNASGPWTFSGRRSDKEGTMRGRKQSFWFPLLGLGFSVSGADKLLGLRDYEDLFKRWGWPKNIMRLVGAAEFVGGVLISSRSQRRRGGMLLAATSGAMLAQEMQHGESDLALPRFALLLASVAAILL
jgi:hypothetical protein